MKLYAAALNFRPIAEEYSVPTDFTAQVHEEAANAQDRFAEGRVDRRDIEFVTIDPVGSMDLDQAVCITKIDGGYRVFYAIADVAAFVAPGSALEAESFKRGQTIYLPDEPARLHPEEISEGRASLLPDVDRPAVLWTFDLDANGEVTASSVERVIVRSRARLDYDGVQADLEAGRVDRRDIEFVTIDPVGSMDLDQAVCITKIDGGYRVFYAIADVAAFVAPGSALEAESFKRGQTIYLPDEPARLHPEEISEGRASLLPDVDRPAVLWTFDLDANGEVTDSSVERAIVRSRARLDYDGVQADLEAGRLHPSVSLLPDVGKLRQASALRRSAVNLRLPSQRVDRRDDGRYELELEPRLDVMEWNSEISLLTGMVAGQMMAAAGVGVLRTLGPAMPKALKEFAVEAQALGFNYQPGRQPVGEFIASLDVTTLPGMAVMREAQKLLRGADYDVLAGAPSKDDVHAGVGGFYAHVTAPLRRLVDRFATETCLAIAAGTPVPDWASSRFDDVAESMRRTTALASNVDRACLRLTEATVLTPYVGDTFPAIVLASMPEQNKSRIFISEPPMLCGCAGSPEEAIEVTVRLEDADIEKRTVTFTWPA